MKEEMKCIYFTYIFFRMPHASKLMQNKVIIIQIMLEFKIFLNIYEKKLKWKQNFFTQNELNVNLKQFWGHI